MEKLYSLVIHPPEEILALVKSMKYQLATEVGWYNSKNSVGHITICEFKATETAIETIKKQISKLCDLLVPVAVHLNEFGSFPNGAFFIAPDNDSKKSLKHIMKRCHKSLLIPNIKKSDNPNPTIARRLKPENLVKTNRMFTTPNMKKSYNPHLTIARRLNPENLAIANSMFTTIDLNFICDSVVLREFDENIT